LTVGDHVRALRGGVWHHAIDVGDRTVIGFTPGAGPVRTSLAAFAAGANRVEVVVHREPVYAPRAVVARAFSRFADAAYAWMFPGPEQFASWCKSGRIPAGEGAPPAGKAPTGRTGKRSRSGSKSRARSRRPAPAGQRAGVRGSGRSRPRSKSPARRPAKASRRPRRRARRRRR
jgi:hypothetical protein